MVLAALLNTVVYHSAFHENEVFFCSKAFFENLLNVLKKHAKNNVQIIGKQSRLSAYY